MQYHKDSYGEGIMSNTLKRYMELKRKTEQSQQEADRAEGALQQVMNQLKKEFGCTTLEDAKKKLDILEKQERKAEIEFEKLINEFALQWPND